MFFWFFCWCAAERTMVCPTKRLETIVLVWFFWPWEIPWASLKHKKHQKLCCEFMPVLSPQSFQWNRSRRIWWNSARWSRQHLAPHLKKWLTLWACLWENHYFWTSLQLMIIYVDAKTFQEIETHQILSASFYIDVFCNACLCERVLLGFPSAIEWMSWLSWMDWLHSSKETGAHHIERVFTEASKFV